MDAPRQRNVDICILQYSLLIPQDFSCSVFCCSQVSVHCTNNGDAGSERNLAILRGSLVRAKSRYTGEQGQDLIPRVL